MSTRATYEINGHTFYIHHDGYPEGAANYFQNAVDFTSEAPNAGFADDFHRANSRAELMDSHESIGGTAYQYTVQCHGDYRFGPYELEITARDVSSGEVFFKGALEDFINAYKDW